MSDAPIAPPDGVPEGEEDPAALSAAMIVALAIPVLYWGCLYVVSYLAHKNIRGGQRSTHKAVIPVGGDLQINEKLPHGKNVRGPNDKGSGGTAPAIYEGESVAEMGLVVKLDEAIDHWNKGLYSPWDAYDKGPLAGHARPVRYKVDGTTPYVMISYNSALKNGRGECPHGPQAVGDMLNMLKSAGWGQTSSGLS